MSFDPAKLTREQYLSEIYKIRSNPPKVTAAQSKKQYLESISENVPQMLTNSHKRQRADAARERLAKIRSEQPQVTSEVAYAQYLRSIEPPSKWIKPEDYNPM